MISTLSVFFFQNVPLEDGLQSDSRKYKKNNYVSVVRGIHNQV